MKLTYAYLTFSKATYADQTYRVRTDSHLYVVDYNGSMWRLRIWTDRKMTGLHYADKATLLMQRADEIEGENSDVLSDPVKTVLNAEKFSPVQLSGRLSISDPEPPHPITRKDQNR